MASSKPPVEFLVLVLASEYSATKFKCLVIGWLKAKIDPADTWRATVQSLDAALKPFYLQARHIGCG